MFTRASSFFGTNPAFKDIPGRFHASYCSEKQVFCSLTLSPTLSGRDRLLLNEEKVFDGRTGSRDVMLEFCDITVERRGIT